ncbi:hypothetical protein [Halioxenophilus sp. WMMB6]|uniref:hypothetical protein n=1 Tax=Halioxenophilus sp. WMMB6 TaxID=3073815 RepID=UPI00295EAA9E|nr:hypothetical protein [Halioxenophilus sp. WMMB6]
MIGKKLMSPNSDPSKFKYHKYCVTEVSGLLVAQSLPQGDIKLFLFDSSAATAAQLLTEIISSPALLQNSSEKIEIKDGALLEFLLPHLPASQAIAEPCCYEARLTGTINFDSQPIQLLEISYAQLMRNTQVLRYSPAQ